MSVTLLLVGAAVAISATGVGAGARGGYNEYRAKKIDKNSNERLAKVSLRLEDDRLRCSKSIANLAEIKLNVLNGSITRFVNNFSLLKNVDFTSSVGLDELSKIHFDRKDFQEMKTLANFSSSIIKGVGTGATAGAVVAIGAYNGAMILGTASTGTAISALSGVAATNATLAWFGGGSLATGGAGIAGGTAVLGGLVAAPALLVMGIFVNAKGGKNFEDAKANAYMTNETCEELENGILECHAIRRRSYMFYTLLSRLDAYLSPLTFAMEEIIKTNGIDYSKYSKENQGVIASAASIAVTIKTILDTPILADDGSLTTESADVSASTLNIVKKNK